MVRRMARRAGLVFKSIMVAWKNAVYYSRVIAAKIQSLPTAAIGLVWLEIFFHLEGIDQNIHCNLSGCMVQGIEDFQVIGP